MKAIALILLAVFVAIGYRALMRRTQQRMGVDPDAIVSTVQKHAWLQWYLVFAAFAIMVIIISVTRGDVDLSRGQEILLLVGGIAGLFVPIFIASRRK